MRRVKVIGLALVALLLLLLAPTVSAQGPDGVNVGGFVFGGSRTIGEGQTYTGDMAVFGGSLTVRPGGALNGDLAVIGGTVDISGRVTGDIFIVGGTVRLRDGAVVDGEVNRIGGSLDQAPGATVRGGLSSPTSPGIPPFTPPRPVAPQTPPTPSNPVLNFLGWVIRTALITIGLALLAVVAMLVLPTPLHNVANTIRYSPAASAGMGALTWIVWIATIILVAIVSALLVIICIGLLGIPVLIGLALVLPIAVLFGWLATGYLIGEGLLRALRIESRVPLMAAGLGTLVITGVYQVVDQVPCIGWLLSWLLTLPGLGAVVLTWFGTRAWRPGDPYLPGGLGPRHPSPSAPLPPGGEGSVPPAPGWSPPLILDAGPTTPTAPPPAAPLISEGSLGTPSPSPATQYSPLSPQALDVEVDQTAPPTPPLVDEPIPAASPWAPPKTAQDLLGRLDADEDATPPDDSVGAGPTPDQTGQPSQTGQPEGMHLPPQAPVAAEDDEPAPPSPWAPRATTTPAPQPPIETKAPPPIVTTPDEPPSPWAPRTSGGTFGRPGVTASGEPLRPSPLSPFSTEDFESIAPTAESPVIPTRRDNLQALPLVGPTYEGLFNARGVYGYAQIAALTPAEVRAMLSGPHVIAVSEAQAQMMIDEARRLSEA